MTAYWCMYPGCGRSDYHVHPRDASVTPCTSAECLAGPIRNRSDMALATRCIACPFTTVEAIKAARARVQLGSQPGAGGATFGSTPHDDRVLAVVLVTPTRAITVSPESALVAAFAERVLRSEQSTARPEEGPQGSAEAPAADESVQPACPTARTCPSGRCAMDPDDVDMWCWKCQDDDPAAPGDLGALRIKYPGVERWIQWGSRHDPQAIPLAQATADRCNGFWHAAGERQRTDLIERLSPIDDPYPEEGT